MLYGLLVCYDLDCLGSILTLGRSVTHLPVPRGHTHIAAISKKCERVFAVLWSKLDLSVAKRKRPPISFSELSEIGFCRPVTPLLLHIARTNCFPILTMSFHITGGYPWSATMVIIEVLGA